MEHDAADINNATCVSGSWNLDASARSVQAAFLFLPDTNAFYYVRSPRARKRKAVPRSFPKGAGERRDESLKNLINGTPVI